jgi:hypothetical protein
VLFWLPLLVIWPRTCMTPLVALFEDGPRIFRRSRRILQEDAAIYVLGGLYVSMAVVLGGLVLTPRVVLTSQMLGSHILDASWRQMAAEYLWIFEALSAAVVVTALAMTWWISLTLLYHEIRWVREGEELRRKIVRLRVLGGERV